MRAIRQGSTGSIGTQALTISVEIEGMLNGLYKDCVHVDPALKEAFRDAMEHIGRWTGREDVRDRILSKAYYPRRRHMRQMNLFVPLRVLSCGIGESIDG